MTTTVSHILKEVAALKPSEKSALLSRLGKQTSPPVMTEDEFEAYLENISVIEPRSSPRTKGSRPSFEPVPTVGQPASESIMEERR